MFTRALARPSSVHDNFGLVASCCIPHSICTLPPVSGACSAAHKICMLIPNLLLNHAGVIGAGEVTGSSARSGSCRERPWRSREMIISRRPAHPRLARDAFVVRKWALTQPPRAFKVTATQHVSIVHTSRIRLPAIAQRRGQIGGSLGLNVLATSNDRCTESYTELGVFD